MKRTAHTTTKKILTAVLIGCSLLLLCNANVVLAKDVTLAWDAHQESKLAG